ncbi:hypothetical protein ACFWIQ_28155 [Kitasatospora sp. NPDC127059]|uniref:hypothetical protein n=1 Tax=unclassified Kitasatospora TaxID=2633591 RepID=UPI0036682A1C
MTLEAAEPGDPVAVLPLWRRGAEHQDADRPGVLRGHTGPVVSPSDQPAAAPDER